MVNDLLILGGLALIARLVPRFVRPDAVGSDSYYHLLAAARIRESGFRLPPVLRGLCFPGPYDYPPLFHYLLALVPPRLVAVAERLSSPVIDTAYVLLTYGFLTWLLRGQPLEPEAIRTRALWVTIAFAISPALLYVGRGPRAYNANPRVLSEVLFASAMIATLAWWLASHAWGLAAASAAVALLLLTSKFGAQVVAFFFPAMSGLLAAPSLLAVPVSGFLIAILATRGHYLRVLKGHVGHLALFARLGTTPAQTRRGEWHELGRWLRSKPSTGSLYQLLCINSVSCFALRNPQLLALALLWWRQPSWGPAEQFLWTWTLVSSAVFLFVTLRPLLFLGEAERYVSYSLPAQFALVALGWNDIPTPLWTALLLYSALLSLAYQAAFTRINRLDPGLASDFSELSDFLRSQPRRLRILPVAESPHKLAYCCGHEIFYPCGNFQVWHTSIDEYRRIYGAFLQPRVDTLAETSARYRIDALLVNKRGVQDGFGRALVDHPRLFENDTFVLYALGSNESDSAVTRTAAERDL